MTGDKLARVTCALEADVASREWSANLGIHPAYRYLACMLSGPHTGCNMSSVSLLPTANQMVDEHVAREGAVDFQFATVYLNDPEWIYRQHPFHLSPLEPSQ
jgi:hypothetical protein